MVSVTYVLELWALSCYFIMTVICRVAGATLSWDLRELWVTGLFMLTSCKDFEMLFWEKSRREVVIWLVIFVYLFVLCRDIRQQDLSFAKKSWVCQQDQTNKQTAWNFRKDFNNNRSLFDLEWSSRSGKWSHKHVVQFVITRCLCIMAVLFFYMLYYTQTGC